MAIASETALNLTLAVVASSSTPTLLLDGEFSVLMASNSFCRAFEIDPARRTPTVFALGAGEWDVPQLRTLLTATLAGYASIDAYEMDLVRAGQAPRRLVLGAQKLEYGDPSQPRLILTLLDITDRRSQEKARDELLRENANLLQELQHRVANSLQIIASVLLMSAKHAHSDETRAQLYEAHQRVMSVATVQRQLAVSRKGNVKLRPYLTDLCDSIGASMIRDRAALKLEVDSDDSDMAAEGAMSVGLIVTELVINSLKHAFPNQRGGRMVVSFKGKGVDWLLTVSDDGVGFPIDPASAPPGLGSSIVEALTRQLRASLTVASAQPGTVVTIEHVETVQQGPLVRAV